MQPFSQSRLLHRPSCQWGVIHGLQLASIKLLWVGLNTDWDCLSCNGFRAYMTSGNFHCFLDAIDSPLAQPKRLLGLCKETVKQSTTHPVILPLYRYTMPTNQKPRTNQYHQTQRWPVQSTSINIKALSLLHNYAGVLLNRGQFDFTDDFFYIYWFSKLHLKWIQARLILLCVSFLQVMGHVALSAITGTTILTPNLYVMPV